MWPLQRSWRAAAGLLAASAALTVGAVAWWSTSSSSRSAMDSADAEGVPQMMMNAWEKGERPSLLKHIARAKEDDAKDEAKMVKGLKQLADAKAAKDEANEKKKPPLLKQLADAKAAKAAQEEAKKKRPPLLKQLADAKAAKAAQAARQATLRRAQANYSESVAEAFAALAKLSYCGPLPGIYAAVGSSCSTLMLPGATSSCERAGFGVVPGSVRILSAADQGVMDSLFGFVAKVEPTGKNSTMKSGVIVAIRGTIDNFANSIRDKQTRMVGDLKGCESCKVHQGYHKSYVHLEWELNLHLGGLLCYPKDCVVYVTGHGSGAAMATMFAWELGRKNFTIGPSYIFESPQLGNDVLAERLTDKFSGGEGKDGPIFSVTTGKDSVPRWPFNASFKSWGLEAHYPDGKVAEREPLCFAGSEDCGIKKVPKDELTSQDTCASPLAPFGTFCTFRAFLLQCWGGLGYETVKVLPTLPTLRQPEEQEAARWHPSSKDGEQHKAIKAVWHMTKAKDWYSLKTLQAFSALAKLAYCGGARGLASAVQSTCSGARGVCGKAGFGVVPESVVGVGDSYQSDLTAPYYMKETLFFYTALIRRTKAKFAKKPYFMPSEACVLVFRGSNNQQNMKMNQQTRQIPLNDTECGHCTANQGILLAWKNALQEKVLAALKHSGCEPNPHKETVDKVYVVGHSMGGTLATLAMYFLHKLKFDVQLSWSIEGGRPGSPALMDYLNGAMLADKRPVPFWEVTHTNDYVPRTPKSSYVDGGVAGRDRFRVHFNSTNLKEVSLCTTRRDMGKNTDCGIYQFDRDELDSKLPSEPHCALPFAPAGQMCMLPGYPAGTPYAIAMQCSWGGSI